MLPQVAQMYQDKCSNIQHKRSGTLNNNRMGGIWKINSNPRLPTKNLAGKRLLPAFNTFVFTASLFCQDSTSQKLLPITVVA